MKRPIRHLILSTLLLGPLAGCSPERLPFAYEPDMRQGVILTQEAVDRLRAGMSRRQVQFILGSPAIVDSFHPDRWEYIQGIRPGRGEFSSVRLTVFFEGDRLTAVSGDFVPADPALRGGQG